MIQYLLSKVQKAKEAKKNSKGVAFWATTVAVTLGLLVAAYYVYQWFSGNTKLAKALHERDVLREKHKQSIVDMRVEKNTEEKTKHLEAARKAAKDTLEAEKKIEEIKVEHKANKEIINRIKDWDDVKAMVKYSN